MKNGISHSEILSLEHSNPESKQVILINWCLGNTCNYSCSYCPDNLHSGSMKWVNYETALSFCTKLTSHYNDLGKRTEFLFTGGEPTLYPYFPKLIYQLKNLQCKVGVITNGSRTIEWWIKNIELFDKIVLTYHHEFAVRRHLLELVSLITGAQVDLHVNFTMLPESFDEILLVANEIFSVNSDISISLKPLLKGFGDEMYEYSQEQIHILSTKRFASTKKNVPSRGIMKKKHENGDEITCKASDLILLNQNHWKNWTCFVGLELLYIDYTGNVYRGTCQQDGKLTNIYLNENFEFPTKPVKCQKEICHCLTDIMTTKLNVGSSLKMS